MCESTQNVGTWRGCPTSRNRGVGRLLNESAKSYWFAFVRYFIKTRPLKMPSAKTNQPPWIEPAKRLRAAWEESGLSQNRVAKLASVDPVTFGDMLKGIRIPRPESLRAVCKVLKISPVWVKTGIGEKRLDTDSVSPLASIGHETRHGPVPGIESWLASQVGVSLDEQHWLRRLQWPEPFVLYPDPVYEMALQLYRSMRNYSRSSVASVTNIRPDGDGR